MIYLFGKHVCLTVVSYVYIFKSLLGSILGKRETYDKHPDYVPSLFLVYDKKGQSPHRSYRKLQRNKRRSKRFKQAPVR